MVFVWALMAGTHVDDKSGLEAGGGTHARGVGITNFVVGARVGLGVGATVVGVVVGAPDVGVAVGAPVGVRVGDSVVEVGELVGVAVGTRSDSTFSSRVTTSSSCLR